MDFYKHEFQIFLYELAVLEVLFYFYFFIKGSFIKKYNYIIQKIMDFVWINIS